MPAPEIGFRVETAHRIPDANVQDVWLFSRNDAVGNLAVIVAAVLVWLTTTPWPDLVVAVCIAGLFLHSAWNIIVAARQELTDIDSQTPVDMH